MRAVKAIKRGYGDVGIGADQDRFAVQLALCYGDRVHRRPASITFFETSFRYIERAMTPTAKHRCDKRAKISLIAGLQRLHPEVRFSLTPQNMRYRVTRLRIVDNVDEASG